MDNLLLLQSLNIRFSYVMQRLKHDDRKYFDILLIQREVGCLNKLGFVVILSILTARCESIPIRHIYTLQPSFVYQR